MLDVLIIVVDSFVFGLQEMDETEQKLRAELENMRLRASGDGGRSWMSEGWEEENKANTKVESDADADAEVSKTAMLDKLEKKKKELVCCFLNPTIVFCKLIGQYCASQSMFE